MDTTTTCVKEPNAEPIPGYRLLEPLGRGGYGEVWKCEAPGGLIKAIKFVPGPQDELDTSPDAATEELKSVERIKSIRHPFLVSMERVENIGGELIIVMELADKSLKDLLAERQAAGKAGIDREELLGYLREAAELLDLMSSRYGLQHLDIKPANLFLVCDHVKVADFGLVQSLAERTGQTPATPLGAVTPRYAAPELFRGKISATSDQFALALVYQELLTGTLPFSGRNFRQLMLAHTTGQPDLSPLAEKERPVLARALAKDPAARYPSCRDFVQGLIDCTAPVKTSDTDSEIVVNTQHVGPEIGSCLSDLQFTGCLGKTPGGEAWSAKGTDGKTWVVNLFYGVGGRNARQNEDAIARLEAITHPALPARRIALAERGCFVVATELIEMNLRGRYQECRARGSVGISRRELLDRLQTAAGALDQLFEQHGLPHLGVNPRNMLLNGDRVFLGEFGLLPVLFHPAGRMSTQLQSRYAAPEVLAGQIGRTADVYSLAIIYQEMLTGTHPFRGKPASSGAAPLLDALPESDRSCVARAIHPDPSRRYGCCAEFIHALAGSTLGARPTLGDFELPALSAKSREEHHSDSAIGLARLVTLLEEAAAATPPVEPPEWQSGPDGDLVLQGRLHVSLPPTGGLAKFEGFRKQWNAQLLNGDDRSAVFQIGQAGGFWQRLRGNARPSLLVEISWTRAQPPAVPLPEVLIRVRPALKGDRAVTALLREQGPTLIDSLRQHFLGHHERRGTQRLLWARPVLATFTPGDGKPVECLGKDLSLTGMGLYLPCALSGAEVLLNLTPEIANDPVVVNGQIVRVQRCGGGWYEAGVLFQ